MEDKILARKMTTHRVYRCRTTLSEKNGVAVNHVGRHSFDRPCSRAISKALSVWPKCLSELPAFAGEWRTCQGEFYVPMATLKVPRGQL